MGRIHNVLVSMALVAASLAGTGERTPLAALKAGGYVPDSRNGGRKNNRGSVRAAIKRRNQIKNKRAHRGRR